MHVLSPFPQNIRYIFTLFFFRFSFGENEYRRCFFRLFLIFCALISSCLRFFHFSFRLKNSFLLKLLSIFPYILISEKLTLILASICILSYSSISLYFRFRFLTISSRSISFFLASRLVSFNIASTLIFRNSRI